jgi:hypothetical protein
MPWLDASIAGKLAEARILRQYLIATGHVASRCRAVSGSLRQRTQAALWGQFFLAKVSAVLHLPRTASHAKIRHFSSASLFHISFVKRLVGGPSNCTSYAELAEYCPSAVHRHVTVSVMPGWSWVFASLSWTSRNCSSAIAVRPRRKFRIHFSSNRAWATVKLHLMQCLNRSGAMVWMLVPSNQGSFQKLMKCVWIESLMLHTLHPFFFLSNYYLWMFFFCIRIYQQLCLQANRLPRKRSRLESMSNLRHFHCSKVDEVAFRLCRK